MSFEEPHAPPSFEKKRRRRLVGLALLTAAGIALAVMLATRHGGPSAQPVAPPPPPRPPKPFRIVFPEGFTRTQMANRVQAVARIAERERHRPVRLRRQVYLRATTRGVVPCWDSQVRTNLEGFLFPATYEFLRKTGAQRLVEQQLDAFCANWRKVNLSYARSKNLTPYDVLIIASMIEKETVAPRERPLVAAVIYNRLRHRMALGIDATLRYGLHIPPTEPIRQSQLASDDPYNTRRFAGLPPTPIANPGLASMRAAAHPARVDYLYFARKSDKVHHFFTASAGAFDRFLAAHGYGSG